MKESILDRLHILSIKEKVSSGDKLEFKIDDKVLHHIMNYKITKSSDMPGTAELEIKLRVKYPNQEST